MRLLVSAFLLVPAALAGTIFDNFGPGDTYGRAGAHSLTFTELHGFRFSSPGAFAVDAVEMALSYSGGPSHEAQAWLMAHSAATGQPGAVLETFLLTGLIGGMGSIVHAPSSLHPLLSAGSDYWLVAGAAGPGSFPFWFFADSDFGVRITGRAAPPDTVWNPVIVDRYRGAFRITGAAVPEPVSGLLLAGGLGIVLAARRRIRSLESRGASFSLRRA